MTTSTLMLLLAVIICLMIIVIGTTTPEAETVKGVFPQFRGKEIYNIDNIELGEGIGDGQYGKVNIGYLRSEKGSSDQTKVAVKTPKDPFNAAVQKEFCQEIRSMIEIGWHPNIMPLLAFGTEAASCHLVTEYMHYGSLKDYLPVCNKLQYVREDRNYILNDLGKLTIAWKIANGMAYLSKVKYIHGDLAARNVLINKEKEVKISDLGFAQNISAEGFYILPPEKERPTKWYSPEANFEGLCTTKGDVWSYGIVLHEIYSFGQDPYLGMTAQEVLAFVNSGHRLGKPTDCPDDVYDIMRWCWQFEASSRPSFEILKQRFQGLAKGR